MADDQQTSGKWTSRFQPIKVGDRVCYSKRFLQSTGQYTGAVPHARGVVTGLIPLGEVTIAEIEWNSPDIPQRVNVKNLSRVTEQGILDID